MDDGQRVSSGCKKTDHPHDRRICGLDGEPEVAFHSGRNKKENMKKLQIAMLTVSLTAAMSASAQIYVLGSSDAFNGPISNGSAPINTTSSQAMIGTGAWQANGTASSQYYLYYNGSSSTELGLGQLTVNDLSSLSFSTYNTTAGALPDWYLIVYTAPYSGGETSWYGNRLILEPYVGNNLTPASTAANQWNTFSTGAGVNQLTVSDSALAGNLGFYGQPTLANIQSGPVTWSAYIPGGSSTPVNYGSMNIKGIVLSTGTGWAAGFTGLVDDVNINSTQGNAQINLEPVPEPTTMAMLVGALLLLPFSMRMLRKTRTQ
jgi:hypothetical protein